LTAQLPVQQQQKSLCYTKAFGKFWRENIYGSFLLYFLSW